MTKGVHKSALMHTPVKASKEPLMVEGVSEPPDMGRVHIYPGHEASEYGDAGGSASEYYGHWVSQDPKSSSTRLDHFKNREQ